MTEGHIPARRAVGSFVRRMTVDTVEDLVAMFDRLIERLDTDAADVRSCLVQILEGASDHYRQYSAPASSIVRS